MKRVEHKIIWLFIILTFPLFAIGGILMLPMFFCFAALDGFEGFRKTKSAKLVRPPHPCPGCGAPLMVKVLENEWACNNCGASYFQDHKGRAIEL